MRDAALPRRATAQTTSSTSSTRPGHVDFSYEVSRSLAACEGALLVVDAAQGVEAQSVANCYTALEQGLEVVPVINKIDLPSADPRARHQGDREHHRHRGDTMRVRVSAKTGENVPELLEELVRRIPPPQGDPDAPLQALIIDSWFDNYVGVVSLVRVDERLAAHRRQDPRDVDRAALPGRPARPLHAEALATESLTTGEVGWMTAGIKDIDGAPVGDTITLRIAALRASRCPASRQVQPRVFAGLFPVQSDEYEAFRDALQKLKLNDSALHYEPEVSTALGFGFRCGFLGLLHMDIVQERLEREYDLTLITSAPTVIYEVVRTDGSDRDVDNPAKLPPSYDRGSARADHHREHPGAAGARRRRAQALPGEARRAEEDAVRSATRCRCSTSCRSRRSCSTSSTG